MQVHGYIFGSILGIDIVNPNQRTSLRGLRTFCAAAEHGSFREAAESLYITASAVSHQIKNLEQELGEPLFERRTRSVALTDSGRSLYEDVRPLIHKIDKVTARHRRRVSRSALRISVQPFFASEMFVPRLADFTNQHPNIDINIDTSDESGEKHPANANASIRVFGKVPKKLVYDRLFSLRLVPAVSPSLREEIRSGTNCIDGEFARIVHERRPDAWHEWERDSGVSLPEPSNYVRMDSMIAVARAAERGLGVALIPVQLSESWFASGSLVKLHPHELCTDDAYYFVCRKDDADNAAVVQFREWVLQKFDEVA